MHVNKLYAASRKLITEAAGVDGLLTKTEAKKLPVYMRERIEAARTSARSKVELEKAVSVVQYGTDQQTFPQGLANHFQEAQVNADGGVKASWDISAAERARITDPKLKDVTDRLWSLAEAQPQTVNGVEAKELSKSKVDSGTKLLTDILRKLDNGDGVITTTELRKADVRFKGEPGGNAQVALSTAINRASNEGLREIDGVAKVIDDARKELQAANSNRDSRFTPDEQKKVKTELGKALLAFVLRHQNDKLADFTSTPEKIYQPGRPFRAPYRANAPDFVVALVKHFNAFSNDNKGAGSNNISRFVMGTVETEGMAKEIAKLSPSHARSILRELEARIQQDPNAIGEPQRVYLTTDAQPIMEKLAKKLGMTGNFKGVSSPPRFDYY